MDNTQDQKAGFAYALAAFLFWGLNPLYFKAVGSASPMEVLAHRILWSVPFIAIMLCFGKHWGELKKSASSPKVLGTLFVTAVLVAVNWLIFIYGISVDKVLYCSLGYYFTPLCNVLMGMIFLKEKLSKKQILAVTLGLIGTLNLTIYYGQLPWISLALPLTFSTYGLLRKTVAIESMPGLFVETALLSPLALIYLIYLNNAGEMTFYHQGWDISLLLIAAGAITSLPLIWFTAGARRMRFATIGLFQYIAPSFTFFLAVAIFDEPFGLPHLVTFALIWGGLGIFAFDTFKQARA
ncbi:EamA family transporter RarD [Dethiosulfatarculus sandiegensis]|uniref:Chloramphenical resistance permease RarD n=1 Tax=Dethiosulfatarculus sandiegensis TaxID=1429043 RepID=A0A0D2JRH4_9BACT|nr:EamA family transporter RarD [Dethiosulfatarculus sandiegensis]KIX12075.1 chloramphenical resistance permease RarD [Dethiosulfatarculus sandiegensis]